MSEKAVPDKVSFFSHIGGLYVGKTVLEFLTGRFKYFSAEQWIALMNQGDVIVNGAPTEKDAILRAGDKVEYRAVVHEEPRVPTHIPVLFEDEDLLIVNKPPHIPMHPTGRYLRNTLIHVLQKKRKDTNIFLAHRLDRETSGVCVLTKTRLGKEKMYWQFFNSEVEKTYWALVWGRPDPPSGMVDVPMGSADEDERESKIRIRQQVNVRGAKTAKTKYHTLGTKWVEAPEWIPPEWPGLVKMKKGQWKSPWPVSLVECRPITGRTNQIRVHMAHQGAGLVGDKLYDPAESTFLQFKDGAKKKTSDKSYVYLSTELKRRLVLDAHALHARRLKFRHPRTGHWMTIDAPLPKTWTGLYSANSSEKSG
jgi:23S rRNA pseudouridine1911/1915/1917 synthase